MSTRASVAAVAAVACAALVACADLTKPYPSTSGGSTAAAATVTAEPPSPAPPPAHTAALAPSPQRIRASHILIAYRGARAAGPKIKRSKAAAYQRAKMVLRLARKGGNFAELAKMYSDGPSARRGGDLGMFTRSQMVKPFSDAAFSLKPGQISNVVATPFGYHIIKRTE